MDIKSLHTHVEMEGFCDVKKMKPRKCEITMYKNEVKNTQIKIKKLQ